jgi:hypothetical protein
MTQAPQIDILLATFNGAEFLDAQVASIRSQTFGGWRLLVSDDGSSDGTAELIEGFCAADPRIEAVGSSERLGSASRNFSFLIESSTSAYFMLADQDDQWLPDKVDKTFQAMKLLEEEHGSEVPLLVCTDMRVVDRELNDIDASFERYARIDSSRNSFCCVLAQSIAAGCTMMGNQTLRDLFTRSAPEAQMVMHDWWLTLIAAAFGHIGHVGSPTMRYRQHDNNAIGAERYSLRSKLRAYRGMRERTLRVLRQAESFETFYGDALPEEEAHRLHSYVSILHDTQGGARLAHLFRSHAWKSGLRKAGQVVAVARLDGSDS